MTTSNQLPRFADLYEQHAPRVKRWLRRRTPPGTDVEDLVQETFLRVLTAVGQYQHPRPFKPWLYAIATNLARNHYKRADTRRTHAAADDGEMEADDWDAPEAVLLAQDEVQTIVAALASLSDEQREVIVLYYYQSLEGAEIAAALNIPLGTVRSRLAAGVRRLRQWMEEKAL